MKKVSVIVPVYNAQKYLRKCAESLVHQTLDDIELIFVNDGSTDRSLEILEEYRTAFPEKVVVISKENGGQASARNLGIKMCNGEYVGFQDADDYVDLHMFERMYELAKENDSDYVECKYHYLKMDEKGDVTEIPQYGHVRAYGEKREMFIDPLVSPWNKIYRASLLKDNGITFTEGVIYEDTAFFIKAIPYIEKMSFLPEAYVYHFLWPGSTMNDGKSMRVGNVFVVLDDIVDFYEKRQYYKIYQKELEYFCMKILLCSSLKRIAQIENKTIRRKFIEETRKFIRRRFPQYRRNNFFRKNPTGIYMLCMNRVTIPLAVLMFRKKKESHK